ncbi:dTMP kinase [Marinomonas algarum]|uniref:Thymidylate kinase n=1 Tax=Marinomonas algarum TaxID=2883105 RepID=A0A9X1IKA5_9GAMM|nr:dTMP kinase [Marinomonas algarum]MCB5160369.1 dTMP kinase [Marinomonas algarum]
MKGKFISLEGGEGSGKSTAIDFIQRWLESHKVPFIMTREPGGTPFSEEIRQLVLSSREEKVNDTAELLLMFAARAQHVAEKIKPAIDQGTWVVSDRFIDSSYVYQGDARGGSTQILDQLTEWAVGDYHPDATLLLDVPVDVGQQRVLQRKYQDRLDKESSLFHQKVRDGFLERARLNPHRIRIIDASLPLEDVIAQIEKQLEALVQSWSGGI